MLLWFLLHLSATSAAPSGAAAPVENSQATAPATLTLEQAVQEAFEHAPVLKGYDAAVGEQRANVQLERARFLPKLGVFAGYVPLFAFATEATGNTYKEGVVALKSPLSEVGAALTLPVFAGMQNIYRLRAQRLQLHAAQNTFDWQAFVLSRLIRYRYREVQAAHSIEQAASEQIKSLQSHLSQVETMLAQRAATQFDVLRVQVRLEEAQTELQRAQDAVVLSRRNLQQAMGLEHDDRPLEGTLPAPDGPSAQSIAALNTDAAPTQRLDIRALDALQSAQRALRDGAQKFWWPTVEIAGQVSRYNNWDRSITDNALYNNAYLVGIRLRMDVFDGLASSSAARASAMRMTRLQEQKREALLQQNYALLQAQRGFLLAQAQFTARTLNMARAETSVRLARAGIAFGTQNSTDLLDAQADLYGARADAVRARLSMEENKVALELALGREMP